MRITMSNPGTMVEDPVWVQPFLGGHDSKPNVNATSTFFIYPMILHTAMSASISSSCPEATRSAVNKLERQV